MKFEKLGSIATIKTGKYDVNHSTPDGEYVFYTCAFGQFKSPTYSFEGPAIILPGNGANVGEVFFYDGKFEAYQRTYVVQNFKADPNYIYAYFKAQWKNSLRNKQFGSATNYIRLNNLTDFAIPLPSLPTQLHIATILSKAESLIAQRKESIRLLDEFLKSTFLEMFGDPGINPKKWSVKTLEEYIEYMGDIGSNGSNEMVAKNLEMLDDEDYAIMIRTTNLTKNDFVNNVKYVTQKTYEFFKKSKIFGGEIIMNKIGSAGDFWLMPKLNKPVSLGLNQLVIRTKNMHILFLFHYLSTDFGRMIVKSQCKGATTKSITKTAVKALPIIVPPIEIQNHFVSVVEKTEALKSRYQQSLQELENLYGSLSQKAFRGELGVKQLVKA